MKQSDIFTVVGIALIAIGAALAYPPLGVFLLGVFILLVGLGMSGKRGEQ